METKGAESGGDVVDLAARGTVGGGAREMGKWRAYLLGRVRGYCADNLLSFALDLGGHGSLLLGSSLLLDNTGGLAGLGGGSFGRSLSGCVGLGLRLLGGRFGGCSLLNLGENTRLGVAGGCASLSGHCCLFHCQTMFARKVGRLERRASTRTRMRRRVIYVLISRDGCF